MERGTASASGLDLSVVGYALFLALGSSGAWGLVTFASMSGMSGGTVSLFENLRSAGFLTVLFACGLGRLFRPRTFPSDTVLSAAAVWSFGFLLLFSSVFVDVSDVLLVAGSLLLGMGHALAFVAWERLFFRLPYEDACRKIVMGSLVSGVVYFAMSLCDLIPLYGVLVALCLAGSTAAALHCRATMPMDIAYYEEVCSRDNSNQLRGLAGSVWRYVVCVAVVGYVSGVSRTICKADGPDAVVLNAVLAAGMVAAAVVLLVAWETVGDEAWSHGAYTPVLVVVTVCFVVLPSLGSDWRLVFAGVAAAGFNMVSMFMSTTSLRVARLRVLDPIAVFGLFAGAVYLCVLLGRLVGGSFDTGGRSVSQVVVIALFCVYALSLSAAAAGVFHGKGEETASVPEAAVSELPAAGGFQAVREVVVTRDVTADYCRAVKRRYGLTNRETDVLELILRGQFVPEMAEALCVSENTVRSHCKTLYKKLDVHSRQQLVELVESCQE